MGLASGLETRQHHGGNVAYVDGHVKWLALMQLNATNGTTIWNNEAGIGW